MLEFEYPFLFVLLIPVLFVLIAYMKARRGSDKRETIVLILFRAIIFFLLVFALTVPNLSLPVRDVEVVFLVDRSASVGESEGEIASFIDDTVKNKGVRDRYAVISFGETPSVEVPLRQRPSPFTLSSFEGKGETNIEEALLLAGSLLGGGGRIVVFSDGNETSGTALDAARLLKDREIEVDYVLMGKSAKEEMALTRFSVSESLYKGERAVISVRIESNSERKANLRISLNDREFINQPIDVKKGENSYSFTHLIQEKGLNVFKAEISADGDTYSENNVAFAVTDVKGVPKLLLVEREESPLLSVLVQSGIETESVGPEQLPDTLGGYLQYDSILFNNVPATDVPEHRMNLIEQAVKDFGKGFIMAGGDNSFGLGGYFQTPIERLLPVDMEIKGKDQLPSLGLVIVLDRSGSMEGKKLALAKEAAARSATLLREGDTLGLIAFDDRPHVIIETGPIGNLDEAIEKIRSVSAGGGTEFYSSLKLAFDQLGPLDLQRKHVILLTDGEAMTGGDYFSLINQWKEKQLTLSTVALGEYANRPLLMQLANAGGGRFYDVQDETVIPSILSRETVMMTKTYIVDDPFYPNIYPIHGWDRLFEQGVPEMNAYIATTAKHRASIPIASPREDPILAEWEYGLGTAIAFTSDVTGKWSGDFAAWSDWPKFLNQMVSRSLPQYDQAPLTVSVENEGGKRLVRLRADEKSLMALETAVVSEKGETVEGFLKLVAPGEYVLDLPDEAGLYYLNAKQTFESGEVGTFQTGFTIPYSEEYLLLGTNEERLRDISNITGGKELTETDKAFRPLNKPAVKRTGLSHLLLLTAFFLLFTEFVIRRFGLSFLVETGRKVIGKKNTSSENKSDTAKKLLEKTRERTRGNSNNIRFESQKERLKKDADTSVSTKPRAVNTDEGKVEKRDETTNREERLKRLLEAKNRRRP